MKLVDQLPLLERALMHPRHLSAQQPLVELIMALRTCSNVKDGYEFQQELLTRVLEVEGDRHAFGRPPSECARESGYFVSRLADISATVAAS